MSTIIQLKRGLSTNITTATLGLAEPAFTTDTSKLYVYDGTKKVLINPFTEAQASGISSQLSTLGTLSTVNSGVSAGQVPLLDAQGKFPVSSMPATVINQTYVVATEVAMLALTASVGDIAVRTDVNKTFILQKTPATSLSSWVQLLSPDTGILSVNGLTGSSVNITANNPKLLMTGFVTPDGVSVQNVLDTDTVLSAITKVLNNSMYTFSTLSSTKAPIDTPFFTGVPKAPTPITTDNSPQIATTAYVKAQGYITAGSAPVTSVNTKTGAVVLVGSDILTGATYAKASSFTPIAITDSINVALGKLEKGFDLIDGGTF